MLFQGGLYFVVLFAFLRSSDVALSLETKMTNIAAYQFIFRCFEGLKADAKDGGNAKEYIGLCIVDMEQILGNL